MDVHPWTKYEIARSRDEERLLRAMAAYRALRGADGGAETAAVESRAGRSRLVDRILRRELTTARASASQAG